MSIPGEPEAAEVLVRRVRGHGLPIIRASVKVALAPEAWEPFLAGLSTSARRFLAATPDPEVWVEAATVAEVMEGFRQQKARDLNPLQGDLAGEAYVALGGAPFASPAALMAAVPHLWAHAFEGGRAQGALLGDREAEVWIWAVVPYAPWMSGFIRHWFRTALEGCGVTGVTVDHQPPEPGGCGHRYRCRWA